MSVDSKTILCVGNFDSNTGYAWKLIESLWVQLSKVGHEKDYRTIACYPSMSIVNPMLLEQEIPILVHDFSCTGFLSTFRTIQFIRNNNVTVLYLTDRPSFSIAYLFFRISGVKKIITHDHTPGYRPPLTRLRMTFKKIRNRIPFVTIDTAIGVSPYVCQRLEDVNGVSSNKIQQVINGVQNCTHTKIQECHDNKFTFKVVTVARANYYKGIDFALKVIHDLVRRKGLDVHYTLIGDGPDLDAFQQQAIELNISDNVSFLGTQHNIGQRLPAFDIAFHPSRGEAMCLAIVEYLRAGLPVVCSTNKSVNSILECGVDSLFYQEQSVNSAAEEILKLARQPELRMVMGVAARRNYIDKYQESKMMDSFSAVIDNCV